MVHPQKDSTESRDESFTQGQGFAQSALGGSPYLNSQSQSPESEESYGASAKSTDESVSTIHHALRASRRRLSVILIAQRVTGTISKDGDNTGTQPQVSSTDRVVTVRQLAREIVSIEQGVTKKNATGEPYHNVYTSLIQTHLPRLDDVAAIKYDSDRKTVRPDQNLIVLATIASITSPVIHLLFHPAVADLYFGGSVSPEDAIGD